MGTFFSRKALKIRVITILLERYHSYGGTFEERLEEIAPMCPSPRHVLNERLRLRNYVWLLTGRCARGGWGLSYVTKVRRTRRSENSTRDETDGYWGGLIKP
jgi:hypothetical protein